MLDFGPYSEDRKELPEDDLSLAVWLTDPVQVCKVWPHLRDTFDAIAEARLAHDQPTGEGSFGRLHAMIPPEVLGLLVAVCPAIDRDKRLFMRWLARRREYAV